MLDQFNQTLGLLSPDLLLDVIDEFPGILPGTVSIVLDLKGGSFNINRTEAP